MLSATWCYIRVSTPCETKCYFPMVLQLYTCLNEPDFKLTEKLFYNPSPSLWKIYIHLYRALFQYVHTTPLAFSI